MRQDFKSPLTPANIRYLISRAAFASSSRWRAVLGRFAGVRFIGVTGSAGKTTTTELIGASLRVAGRVRQTDRLVGRLNNQRFVVWGMLGVASAQEFVNVLTNTVRCLA